MLNCAVLFRVAQTGVELGRLTSMQTLGANTILIKKSLQEILNAALVSNFILSSDLEVNSSIHQKTS